MRKRIMCLILSLCMVVGVVTGCGSSDSASSDNVTVTKKLEKEYTERIEAYQEYYNQVKNDYRDYEIGVLISLDDKGLPYLWICSSEDNSRDNAKTQLVGFEDGEACVLAERDEALFPYGSTQFFFAVSWDNDGRYNYYLYDNDKKDFRNISGQLESLEDSEQIYSEEELKENLDFLIPILEAKNFYDSLAVYKNDSSRQIAYLGKINENMTLEALDYLNVVGWLSYFNDIEKTTFNGTYLKSEYGDNKVAINYFEKLTDADMTGFDKEDILNEYGSEMYGDTIKAYNIKTFTDSSGIEHSYEDYSNSISASLYILQSDGWDYGEGYNYVTDAGIGTLFRGLLNNPVYSAEELVLYIASINLDYEITEIDLNDYTLSKASNESIASVVYRYFSDFFYFENFYEDDIVANRDAVFETEPYKSMKENKEFYEEDVSYAENIATVTCSDGKEYQFQIEFNEAGDKISKITCISPSVYDSSNKDSDWLSAYMDCVSENNLYAFVLADIDNSGVPALIYQEGIYKYNGSSVNQVRDNYTTAVKVGDDRSSVLVVCDGSVYGEYVIYNTETFEEQRAFIAEDTTEGYGEWIYYWSDDPDTILSQEEASSVFADLDKKYPVTVFDGYSNVYFDTVEEAYNYYLENKDVSYSSSTENVVVSSTEETYNELEIYIKHFEVENGRLIIQVDTEDERYKHDDDSIKDGLLDMAISSDCIWGSINVGEAAPTESNKSYEEVKKGIDTARSRYVQDGTYEDARGVSIVVKDGVVMKVYTVSS